MGNISKILQYLVPAILGVQAALPTLKGSSKQAIAINIAKIAAGITEQLPNAHLQQIGAITDVTVQVLQAQGVFGKDQVPAL